MLQSGKTLAQQKGTRQHYNALELVRAMHNKVHIKVT